MARTAVELTDFRLLQRDAGVAGTLKKLMHLRAAFEEPLLDVFGFPFILRHQVFVAGCCICCASCCCCGTVPAAPVPSNLLPQDSSCIVDPATDCPSHCSADASACDINSTLTRKVLSSNGAIAVSGSALCTSVSRDCKTAYPLSSTATAGGGSAGAAGGTCYDFWVPCNLSRCSCCRGYARAFSSKYGTSIHTSRSASSSRDCRSTGSHETETSIPRIVSRNRKRQRLVGEDPVAAVVAAAVGSHQSSRTARTQDERSVEILLSRSVIRQVKLPIELGSYVLFFTSDWLQCLQRSIDAAQREALSLLHQQQRCSCVACGGPISADVHDAHCCGNSSGSSGSSRNNAESYETDRHNDSSGNQLHVDTEATFCWKCKGSTSEGCYVATLKNSSSCYNNNIELRATERRITGSCVSPGKAQSDVCSTVVPRAGGKCCRTTILRSAETRAVSNKYDNEEDGGGPLAVPLLRFTPVLRQDEVQPDTGDPGVEYNVADVSNLNSRKKQMLLDLPVRLGEQLKDVLLTEFLNIHTQTHIEKRALEEVLRNYLHAWHQRRHDTIVYLRDVLRSSDDLLRKAEERREKTETRLSGEVSENNSVITNVKTGNTSAACVSASNVIYSVKRERINAGEYRNEAKEILQKREQRESLAPQTKMYARASVKEVVHLWRLLQCGCEAAAEVFTLGEHAAAGYTGLSVKHEDLPPPEIWNAERQTDEGKAAADNDEVDSSVHGIRREEHKRKCEQRRQMWRVKMEEEEAKVEETTLSSSEEQTKKCPGGVRVGESNTTVNRQAPIAHSPVTLSHLREKIRRATAVMQLLAEGEKALMSTPDTSQMSLVASGQSSRVHGQICRLSRATAIRTDSFTPAVVLEKTNLNLATDVCMSRVSVRRSGKAPNSPQQRGESPSFTATRTQHREGLNARGEKEGSKSESTEEQQHTQDVAESRLQQEISGVMLLLYDAPFLYSRAGSDTVTLALPQQGLLVRWLQDGRKEALQSIRRRRFKEVLWVDIERRGFHKSGLGSRFTLLDLKGIGEVECIETAAGVVVRLAGSPDD